MTHPLKSLLERLGIDPEALSISDLGYAVEQDVARLRTQIGQVPSPDDKDEKLFKYVLAAIRHAAQELVKGARKRELELELRLLDKPDEVDLQSEEWKHTALHLEAEQLAAEIDRRKGEAFLRFCKKLENREFDN